MEEQRDAEGVALYVKAQFTVKTSSRNVSLTSYNRGAIFLVQLSSLAWRDVFISSDTVDNFTGFRVWLTSGVRAGVDITGSIGWQSQYVPLAVQRRINCECNATVKSWMAARKALSVDRLNSIRILRCFVVKIFRHCYSKMSRNKPRRIYSVRQVGETFLLGVSRPFDGW